jgi:hypothetical protein
MPATGRRLTKEEAEEELARYLYESMERADPSWPPEPWESLSADERDFYANRINDVLRRRELLLVALECRLPESHNL